MFLFLCVSIFVYFFIIRAASWQNQQNGMCAQRRLGSAWASAQSDQSSLCAQWVAKDLSFLQADSEDSQTGRMPRLSEDWSDWADAQADPSLRWAHMPFYWFCHDAAHTVDAPCFVIKLLLLYTYLSWISVSSKPCIEYSKWLSTNDKFWTR